VLYQPLLRHRLSTIASSPGAGTKQESAGGRIERVRIVDGEVAFVRQRDHVDDRLGNINAEAVIDDKSLTVTGTALNAEHRMTFEFKNTGVRNQTALPFEFVMKIPDLSTSPLQGRLDFSASGTKLSFAKVEARLGDSTFRGQALVDIANKPQVALELDFERLSMPLSTLSGDSTAASQTWSNVPFSSDWLNYVDADLRFTVGEVRLGTMELAALAAKSKLEDGVMKINLAEGKPQTPQPTAPGGRKTTPDKTTPDKTAPDKGRVNANVTLDVSGDKQKIAIQSTFRDIPARPLLEAVAGFDRLEGRLQASIAVDSQGNSQQAVMSNLQGVVSLDFRDGAVRGINVAQMIRSLTSDSQSDSQQSGGAKTDLSQLSASFSIDKGRASTSDLKLVGPMVRVTGAGTVDLGTRQMELRVEPTLVMTLEGQGRDREPGGFSVPLTITGPWTALQIHPDIPGMLDSPQTQDTLEQIGASLFGKDGIGKGGFGNFFGGNGGGTGGSNGRDQSSRPGGEGGGSGGGIGGFIGDMIQQGFPDGGGSGGQRRPGQ